MVKKEMIYLCTVKIVWTQQRNERRARESQPHAVVQVAPEVVVLVQVRDEVRGVVALDHEHGLLAGGSLLELDELSEEAGVRPYVPQLPQHVVRIEEGVPLVLDEVREAEGGRAGDAGDAVDERFPGGQFHLVDQVRNRVEPREYVAVGLVVDADAKVDDVRRQGGVRQFVGGVHHAGDFEILEDVSPKGEGPAEQEVGSDLGDVPSTGQSSAKKRKWR